MAHPAENAVRAALRQMPPPVRESTLYFADRLTWGLTDGELRYLEAVALEAEVDSEGAE